MNDDAMSAIPARSRGSASTAALLPAASTDAPRPRFATVCGFVVVVTAGALVVLRFVGEAPPSRNAESLLAAVAVGVLIAAPGLLMLVAERTDRPVLLLAAAGALVPLSLLSIVTIPLLVVAVAMLLAWNRRPAAGSRWRAMGSVLLAVCGCIAAVVLLFGGTTTRTFTDGSTVYGTDGWVPWATSIAIIGVVAVALSAATWLAPQGPAARPPEALLR